MRGTHWAKLMKYSARRLTLTAATLFVAVSTWAQTTAFSRVRVVDGPVLEYPAHWKIADEASVQNRVHGAQAIADAANVDVTRFQKRSRVIIESQPFPISAQIHASIVTPQEFTQDDLKVTTADDLRQLKVEFETNFRKMSASSMVKLSEVGEVRVEKVAGRLALVIPYTRYTTADPEIWHVEQLKIPFENRILSMTVSYQSSQAAMMKPILERVKRTLAF